jgi:dTDP-4-amino-4,6-dideoxygalactose transaminase
VHYRGVHLYRYYRERYAIDPGSLPISTDMSERTLSLPLGPGVTAGDLADVTRALHSELG